MWPGENSESSDRAVNLGVGAASPLWPGFLLAAAAGVAYWGWTRWFRPDAVAKLVEPDLSAPPASTKGTPVAAKEPADAELKLPEAPAPVSAALEAAEVLLSPPPETAPPTPPAPEEAPSEPSLQAAAVAPVAESGPTIPPPVATPTVAAKPAAASAPKAAKPAAPQMAGKTPPAAAPVKAATANQSAPKAKAAAKPKAADAPKPAPVRRKAPSAKA